MTSSDSSYSEDDRDTQDWDQIWLACQKKLDSIRPGQHLADTEKTVSAWRQAKELREEEERTRAKAAEVRRQHELAQSFVKQKERGRQVIIEETVESQEVQAITKLPEFPRFDDRTLAKVFDLEHQMASEKQVPLDSNKLQQLNDELLWQIETEWHEIQQLLRITEAEHDPENSLWSKVWTTLRRSAGHTPPDLVEHEKIARAKLTQRLELSRENVAKSFIEQRELEKLLEKQPNDRHLQEKVKVQQAGTMQMMQKLNMFESLVERALAKMQVVVQTQKIVDSTADRRKNSLMHKVSRVLTRANTADDEIKLESSKAATSKPLEECTPEELLAEASSASSYAHEMMVELKDKVDILKRGRKSKREIGEN